MQAECVFNDKKPDKERAPTYFQEYIYACVYLKGVMLLTKLILSPYVY